MENLAIARVLDEIADLLEIKGANPFKIRAYRNAATAVATSGERVAGLTDAQVRAIPGIGKDLSARIREIAETGDSPYHQELLQEFPPTILDLLRLQGVGPKTVALLYSTLQIRTLDELEAAARAGRLSAIKGMGRKKAELILKSIEEQKRRIGRHLMPDAHDVATAVIAHLREGEPGATIEFVGSLRRGCDTCGDLDILATGASGAIMDAFTGYGLVERVLGRGDTKSSVLLRGGLQADLRLVPQESRGAALQYFTGSKAHNIALRDRAIRRGFKLNEYGLFEVATGGRVAGETEEGVYQALGLAFIPPELREDRGEIAAAAAGTLPRLVARADLRGDVHTHTTATDGRDDLDTMALAARAAGLDYIVVTDHSKALAMANGLDERRALEHAARIRALGARLEGITLLAGIECDILQDGTLDLDESCLAELDYVVASVHSRFGMEEAAMTDRLLRAIASPVVDAIGHPTGRRILTRVPYRVDLERVVDAAVAAGVALEINCQVDRLDLSDINARMVKERGGRLVIGSDAHSRGAFGLLRWGVIVARRAGLEPADVLNTRPLAEFRASLRRNRRP
jgi:DNA polymerase (family 10)